MGNQRHRMHLNSGIWYQWQRQVNPKTRVLVTTLFSMVHTALAHIYLFYGEKGAQRYYLNHLKFKQFNLLQKTSHELYDKSRTQHFFSPYFILRLIRLLLSVLLWPFSQPHQMGRPDGAFFLCVSSFINERSLINTPHPVTIHFNSFKD